MARPDHRAPRNGEYGDNERYEGSRRDERQPGAYSEPRSYRDWLARRGYVDERRRDDPGRGHGGHGAGPRGRGHDGDLAGRSFDAERPVVDFEDPWIPRDDEAGPYYPGDEFEFHPHEPDPYSDEPRPRRGRYYADRGPWAEQARPARGRFAPDRYGADPPYRGDRRYQGYQEYRGSRAGSYGGGERYGREETYGAGARYDERQGGDRRRGEGYAHERYADEPHARERHADERRRSDRVYGSELERALRGRPEPRDQYHGEREYGGEPSYGGVRDYSHDRDYGRPRGMQHGYQQYGNDELRHRGEQRGHPGEQREYPRDRRVEGQSARREHGGDDRDRDHGDDRYRYEGYGRDSGPSRGGPRR